MITIKKYVAVEADWDIEEDPFIWVDGHDDYDERNLLSIQVLEKDEIEKINVSKFLEER